MTVLVGTIQERKDTSANWTSANPVLLDGEYGLETDTKKRKLGDGVTAWNSLAYYSDPLAEQMANKGQANGYAPLNGSSQIPQQYLPAFVDDVLEFANLAAFPGTGETGKIYIADDTGKQYRWSGSSYIAITNGLIASTDNVPEGSTNLYFTVARVLASVLTGFSPAITYSAIVATDTILQGFGKLQKGVTDLFTAIALKMDKSANLSDLADVGTARTNLGLGGAATLNVGTSSGTVAAGDDGRIKGFQIVNYTTAVNLADATTYYIGLMGTLPITSAGFGNASRRVYINKAGTITSAQITIMNANADGTAENATFSLRMNDTTDYLISNAVQFSSTAPGKIYNITGLNIPVAAGDYQVTKILTPTWVTNPLAAHIQIIYYIE